MIITIDGPAGTGKTTIAKKVAERLHFLYFDTGAMYRAVTWAMMKKNIAPSDAEKIKNLLENFAFTIKGENKQKKYYVDEMDVTEEIRSVEVTRAVSEVSALAPVRESLWSIQRNFAKEGNAVFEGRDMGTVVFPDAEVKIFLTARPEVRAQRRMHEMLQKNPQEAAKIDQDILLEEMAKRDAYDSSRSLAPLKCPEDAFVIDTSDLTIDEIIESILKYKDGHR